MHALKKSEKYLKKTFDFVILLQPTSPLRNAKDIDVAIKKIINRNKNSLISVCDVEGNHPNRMKIVKKNILINFVNFNYEDMRPRQKLKKVYIRNGAIYITNRNFLKKNMKIADKVSIPYIMSADRSVNIDTPIDVVIAQNILASKL